MSTSVADFGQAGFNAVVHEEKTFHTSVLPEQLIGEAQVRPISGHGLPNVCV